MIKLGSGLIKKKFCDTVECVDEVKLVACFVSTRGGEPLKIKWG